MPEIIETTVYRLNELSDAAKDKARAWYREGGFDYNWYDAVYEDFQRIAEILGLKLKTRTVRLMGGGTRQEPCIWFRGFSSQGDGACFESWYSYRKHAPRLLREYAPLDTELHRIADALQTIQRRNFYQLRADASHRGHYYHEYCMSISVEGTPRGLGHSMRESASLKHASSVALRCGPKATRSTAAVPPAMTSKRAETTPCARGSLASRFV